MIWLLVAVPLIVFAAVVYLMCLWEEDNDE